MDAAACAEAMVPSGLEQYERSQAMPAAAAGDAAAADAGVHQHAEVGSVLAIRGPCTPARRTTRWKSTPIRTPRISKCRISRCRKAGAVERRRPPVALENVRHVPQRHRPDRRHGRVGHVQAAGVGDGRRRTDAAGVRSQRGRHEVTGSLRPASLRTEARGSLGV